MIKRTIILILYVILTGCNSTPKEPLSSDSFHMTSTDPEYGYLESKPIELGGFLMGTKYKGAHIDYFQSLLGPNGEIVEVQRLGSCCAFEDKSMPFGGGLLDMYQLSYEGIEKPVVIYVNLYKFNQPKAPKGFALL